MGGYIQNVSIDASGAFTVNAFLAGNGGLSSAGTGGAGGSLLNDSTASEAGAALAAAGNGGDGLVAGGAGGNLTTMVLNSGAQDDARVVAMAGKGGDAYAVTAAQIAKENPTTDPVPTTFSNPLFQPLAAMGSVNGKGGSGGSINTLTQPQGILVSTDVIAGNGGSTINYGMISDLTTGVGKGGSISNVNLAGDAGIMDSSIEIKDYSSTFVSDIAHDIRSFGFTFTLADYGAGNVGVLAGNKGFIRDGNPVTGGSTGSVSHFKAQNIMSMVAGSVENIATIASATDIGFQNTSGIIGAYKTVANGTPVPFSNVDPKHSSSDPLYYTNAHYTGTLTPDASAGGSLVDGAVLAGTYSGPISNRTFFITQV